MRRLNLGELIDLLKRCPQKDLVKFDFGSTTPGQCDSYRGYYEDLALGFEVDASDYPTVAELQETLTEAIGETFQGWKGGEYRMDRNSRLWVANCGQTSDTTIVGICDCNYMTVLQTEWAP